MKIADDRVKDEPVSGHILDNRFVFFRSLYFFINVYHKYMHPHEFMAEVGLFSLYPFPFPSFYLYFMLCPMEPSSTFYWK